MVDGPVIGKIGEVGNRNDTNLTQVGSALICFPFKIGCYFFRLSLHVAESLSW